VSLVIAPISLNSEGSIFNSFQVILLTMEAARITHEQIAFVNSSLVLTLLT